MDRPVVEFDLTRFQDLEARARSGLAPVSFGAAAFIVLIGVAFGVSEAHVVTHDGPTSLHGGLAIGVTAMAAGLAVLMAAGGRVNLRGARRLKVTSGSVELWFNSPRPMVYRWDRPGRSFQLLDYSEWPIMVKQDRVYYLNGPHTFSRTSCIPKAAFDAVLAAARVGGARIKTSKGSIYNMGPIYHRISYQRPPKRLDA